MGEVIPDLIDRPVTRRGQMRPRFERLQENGHRSAHGGMVR
jgi:hypothetical protein